jgi:cyclophilin family peptidyl-prolyl cis-trans isomerase
MNKKSLIICLSVILIGTTSIFAQNNAATAQEIKKETMNKDYLVEITTDFGKMKLKLSNETPQHRDNFVKLVSEGFYDSLLFHRIIKGFMIQGGDPQSKNAPAGKALGMGDVGYKVPAEFSPNLYHKKGALCAARDGNPQKASSGCQFYIVQGKLWNDNELTSIETRTGKKLTDKQKEDYKTLGGYPPLDNDYTVFGEMVEGFDVLDKIAATPTQPGDRPTADVKMTMKLVEN